MKFSIKTDQLDKQRSDVLVIGVYESLKVVCDKQSLSAASISHIASLLKHGDMSGKVGSSLILYNVPGIKIPKILLIGLGKEKEFDGKKYHAAVRFMVSGLKKMDVKSVTSLLQIASVKEGDIAWNVEHFIYEVMDASYEFAELKTVNKKTKKFFDFFLEVDKKSQKIAEEALKKSFALAKGIELTKTLGNLPPNICTPTFLGKKAQEIGKEHDMKIDVLDQKQIEKLKMGSFLGVAKGSRQPPKFIVLQHNKAKKTQKPIILVGKGITFDAGGISIKPASDMDEMKYDMCGAASVLGTFKTIGLLKLPINVIGIIPTCENLPDGLALKPGDILTSMSGQTIEVLNTDAEGRLILCDALTYAERFNPDVVIDIATLTGACVIALGHHASGLYSNDDKLAKDLELAGQVSMDRAWRMPLWEDYQSQLDSNFADMANIGGRAGGSITAACFLSRFAK
ncbi:MAG: aminopeptidase a cyteinylglycinase, partial [Pseudomonadota bacterium]